MHRAIGVELPESSFPWLSLTRLGCLLRLPCLLLQLGSRLMVSVSRKVTWLAFRRFLGLPELSAPKVSPVAQRNALPLSLPLPQASKV